MRVNLIFKYVFSCSEALIVLFHSDCFINCTEVSKNLVYSYRNPFGQVISGSEVRRLKVQRVHVLFVTLRMVMCLGVFTVQGSPDLSQIPHGIPWPMESCTL